VIRLYIERSLTVRYRHRRFKLLVDEVEEVTKSLVTTDYCGYQPVCSRSFRFWLYRHNSGMMVPDTLWICVDATKMFSKTEAFQKTHRTWRLAALVLPEAIQCLCDYGHVSK
jgi:hypothetical protein